MSKFFENILILQQIFGLDGAFWLFACISCAGLCFVIVVVPETKGKDLEEMAPQYPKYMKEIVVNRWDMETHVEYLV